MFQQVGVPVLGSVENMSCLTCPACGERIDVFSYGGGRKTAETMNVPFLGELALDPGVRIGGDTGKPVALADAAGFVAIAREVIARSAEGRGGRGPRMEIED